MAGINKKLNKDFFKRNTIKVAKELLGKIIEYNGLKGKIVETEAYGQDEASHAYKKTERSRLMYETFGKVYVYLVYGNYYCLNFTTEENKPGAVLIRAIEPLRGLDLMKKRRKSDDLCSGPGKLCKAFNIDKNLNGTDINDKIKIYDNKLKFNIVKTTRVGISRAQGLKLRFYLKGNKFVSKP